jgi:hypothetical protein
MLLSSPAVTCLACGHRGRGADPHVGARAMILALARFGVVAREPGPALENAWSAHRKSAGPDLFVPAPASEPALDQHVRAPRPGTRRRLANGVSFAYPPFSRSAIPPTSLRDALHCVGLSGRVSIVHQLGTLWRDQIRETGGGHLWIENHTGKVSTRPKRRML